METPDLRQASIRSLQFFDRNLNQYEAQLKTAIESDPRVKVLRLQVRRYMKTDRVIAKRGGVVNDFMLLFEFVCPCGGTRMELFSVPLKWKQPEEMAVIKDGLAKFTYDHLEKEGFLT